MNLMSLAITLSECATKFRRLKFSHAALEIRRDDVNNASEFPSGDAGDGRYVAKDSDRRHSNALSAISNSTITSHE